MYDLNDHYHSVTLRTVPVSLLVIRSVIVVANIPIFAFASAGARFWERAHFGVSNVLNQYQCAHFGLAGIQSAPRMECHHGIVVERWAIGMLSFAAISSDHALLYCR